MGRLFLELLLLVYAVCITFLFIRKTPSIMSLSFNKKQKQSVWTEKDWGSLLPTNRENNIQ